MELLLLAIGLLVGFILGSLLVFMVSFQERQMNLPPFEGITEGMTASTKFEQQLENMFRYDGTERGQEAID